MRKEQSIGLDEVLFLILVADILFAPFLLSVPAPIAFIILPLWLIALRETPTARALVPAAVGAALATISYVYGLRDGYLLQELARERMANTAIVIFMFGAYVMLMTTQMRSFAPVATMLRLYLIFLFGMALIFFVSPGTYFGLRTFWSFNDSVEFGDQVNILTRFTGTMSDPNNLAVSTCAITAVLVFYQEAKVWLNLFALAMTGVIIVATMSATGVICFSILAAAFILASKLRVPMRIGLLLASAITGLAIYYVIRETEIFRLATERVMESDADSRFSRWATAMDMGKFVSSILIGDGGSIFMNNFEYHPHNGHIHLVYSFGLICYICFASIFFRIPQITDWRRYLFLAILVIGFTVNVGIYEHRFAGVWVILMVIYHQMTTQNVSRPNRSGSAARQHRPQPAF